MQILDTTLRHLCLILALAFVSVSAHAAEPTGRVILEIEGFPSNGAAVMQFDRSMLEAMDTIEVVTDTPWTEGEIVFSGVLMRDVLDIADGQSGMIRAVALNDYAVDIPIADVLEHDVILALQRDGRNLTVRDKGPLWVIYPWLDNPRLRTELTYSRSIWQLRRLEFVAQ